MKRLTALVKQQMHDDHEELGENGDEYSYVQDDGNNAAADDDDDLIHDEDEDNDDMQIARPPAASRAVLL